MDFFSPEFFTALLMIIAIDILLGGDNAVVIAMASRKLPAEQKKKAIVWGTGMAIIVRVIATVLAAYLLQIPFLFLVGGLILIWIAFKLLVEDDDGKEEIKAGDTLMGAIRTIIVADVMMGLDNVLAVAGSAHGNIVLIVIGLVVSIPIMIWGSSLILKAMERYAWIQWAGGGILAYAAASMITHEKEIEFIFTANPWVAYLVKAVIVIGVVGIGFWQRNRNAQAQMQAQVSEKDSQDAEKIGIGS
ncbi:TerC family protein [Brevibacillus dissolubilis]|uniref:TerC family protein n=1 Tax=Brevibacillus dissolubilis TaxID=1844116 RepID=UPI001116F377|nr:TerC family protein [Brevibacillus dissolubilis]